MKPARTPPQALVYILGALVIAGIGLAVCGPGRTIAAGLGVEVVVTPARAALASESTQPYQAAVSGVVNKGATRKAEPANRGGTADGNGLSTAPTAPGTILATSAAGPAKSGGRPHHPASGRRRGGARKPADAPSADAPRADAVVSPPRSIDPSAFLPADRATAWNPGLMGGGGIPVRSTICATLAPRGGALDDTAQIQGAINRCPAGQVVQLAAGTFIINSGNFLLIGAGPGQTTLAKTNDAKHVPGGRQRQALAADHRRSVPVRDYQ
jgi:hypothetical protein